MNLPMCPPGANCNRFNLLTFAISTPGIFLTALINFTFSLEYMNNGPLLY
jgi:hypothetical protein